MPKIINRFLNCLFTSCGCVLVLFMIWAPGQATYLGKVLGTVAILYALFGYLVWQTEDIYEDEEDEEKINDKNN